MSPKKNIVGSAMIAATMVFAAQAVADSKKVGIYNWSDYIGVDTLDGFAKDVRLETNYDSFDSLELLEKKLLVGRSGYDVVVPSAEYSLARLIHTKAVQPLDKKKIPNLANLDADLMKRLEGVDPENKYAVIYQWGAIGFGVLPDMVKTLAPNAPLDSWDILFKPEHVSKLARCGVVLMDSVADVLPTALHYLGLDPNSEIPEDLKKVDALLMRIRPYIKTFVGGRSADELAAGRACLAFGYSGDILQAAARAKDARNGVAIRYVAPKEGAQLWFDVMAIPADAPNPDGAHQFINYVLQPKVMAGISNATQYANAVSASWPLIQANIRSNAAVFPSPEARAKLFVAKSVSLATERLRAQVWAKFKVGAVGR